MAPSMKEIGTRMSSVAEGSTSGQMGASMTASGATTSFMGLASTHGQMESVTQANTKMILNMAMGYIPGPMANAMMEAGNWASRMEKLHLPIAKGNPRSGFGVKEKELSG